MTKDKSIKLRPGDKPDSVACDDLIQSGLEMNKAMFNKDADRLISAVVAFLTKHGLSSSPEIAAQIPVTHFIQVISSKEH